MDDTGAIDVRAAQRHLLSTTTEMVEIGPRQLRTFVMTLNRLLPTDEVRIPDPDRLLQSTPIILLPETLEVLTIGLVSTTIMIAIFLLVKPKASDLMPNKQYRHIV